MLYLKSIAMKTIKLLLVLLTLLVLQTPAKATIWYVNINATGLNNGTSWANAFTTLNPGIGWDDTVWVANGVYKPTATTDRNISFPLDNRKFFGGFVGNETSLDQRDLSSFKTVLSGDIGIPGDSTDNSYHVITLGMNATGWIDGFKITGGNANASDFFYGTMGGGIYLHNLSFLLMNNCLISNNAAIAGGGLYSHNSTTKAKNCIFNDNSATVSGGAMVHGGMSARGLLENCSVNNNRAAGDGGAISYRNSLQLKQCTISGNQSGGRGGAIYCSAGIWPFSLELSNSLFVGNTAASNSVLFFPSVNLVPYGPTIEHCTFSGNKSASGRTIQVDTNAVIRNSIIWGNETGGAEQVPLVNYRSHNIIENSASTANNTYTFGPQFVNPGLAANAPFNAADYNYWLSSGSLAIDTGSAAVTGYSYDLDGTTRVQGAGPDLGCYETNYCATPGTGDITAGGDTVFCYGQSVALTAPAGTAYTWSNGAHTQTTTAYTSGNYYVNVTGLSGCYTQYSQQVLVHTPEISISGIRHLCGGAATTLTASGSVNNYNWSNGITTPGNTLTLPGDYYVTGTDNFGCTATSDTIHLTVVPLPAITINGDTSYCADNGTELTASGDIFQYLWSNNVATAANAINTPGSYYVMGTDYRGCTNTSDTVEVISIPLPEPVITQNGDTLQTGVFDSYQWLKHNQPIPGAIAQFYVPTKAGSYRVRVTSQGCDSISALFFIRPLSIEDAATGSHLSVYPNPARDYLVIAIPEGEKVIHYSIYDATGRAIVQKEPVQKQLQQLRLNLPAHAAAGNYVLLLQTGQRHHSLKFTIRP
jgi:predicted outer membrane repeat protein